MNLARAIFIQQHRHLLPPDSSVFSKRAWPCPRHRMPPCRGAVELRQHPRSSDKTLQLIMLCSSVQSTTIWVRSLWIRPSQSQLQTRKLSCIRPFIPLWWAPSSPEHSQISRCLQIPYGYVTYGCFLMDTNTHTHTPSCVIFCQTMMAGKQGATCVPFIRAKINWWFQPGRHAAVTPNAHSFYEKIARNFSMWQKINDPSWIRSASRKE